MTENDNGKIFHQENSYPRYCGYEFSRSRTLVLMSTSSLGEN
jgi:hypothetical protein